MIPAAAGRGSLLPRSQQSGMAMQESSLCAKPSPAPSSAHAYGLLRSLLLKQCHQQELSSSADTGLWQESSPVMPRVPSLLRGCPDQPSASWGGETAQGEASAPLPPCKKRDLQDGGRMHRCSFVEVRNDGSGGWHGDKRCRK